MRVSTVTFVIAFMIAVPAFAEHTYWHQTRQTNENQFHPDSLNNPFGRYGSQLSPESPNNQLGVGSPLHPDSLSNPLGRYGSQLSPESPFNPLGEYGNQLSPNSTTNQLSPYYNPGLKRYQK